MKPGALLKKAEILSAMAAAVADAMDAAGEVVVDVAGVVFDAAVDGCCDALAVADKASAVGCGCGCDSACGVFVDMLGVSDVVCIFVGIDASAESCIASVLPCILSVCIGVEMSATS